MRGLGIIAGAATALVLLGRTDGSAVCNWQAEGRGLDDVRQRLTALRV